MYEEAEALWANGAFVDAIDSFRDYLRVFPGEYHVHKRIADIYEKDLVSFRAAAMEYEEMLEMDIPRPAGDGSPSISATFTRGNWTTRIGHSRCCGAWPKMRRHPARRKGPRASGQDCHRVNALGKVTTAC
ncbi:MAG: hypothetical protein Ct9H300mP32_4600 [Verrucomicrobiota bacterium]|nr:MAG: hypothetical protein Ct9H300mP32_4600 [Verrucomicrobiota bacterium]